MLSTICDSLRVTNILRDFEHDVMFPQVCEQLKAQIAAKQAELDTSKATILSLLEGSGGGEASANAPPDPPAHSLVASSLGTATSVSMSDPATHASTRMLCTLPLT